MLHVSGIAGSSGLVGSFRSSHAVRSIGSRRPGVLSMVARRQGRSGRLLPLHFGTPINGMTRPAFVVDVSTSAAASVYFAASTAVARTINSR
jgi:hypothetical protein